MTLAVSHLESRCPQIGNISQFYQQRQHGLLKYEKPMIFNADTVKLWGVTKMAEFHLSSIHWTWQQQHSELPHCSPGWSDKMFSLLCQIHRQDNVLGPGDARATEQPSVPRQKHQGVRVQPCDRVRPQHHQPFDLLQYREWRDAALDRVDLLPSDLINCTCDCDGLCVCVRVGVAIETDR